MEPNSYMHLCVRKWDFSLTTFDRPFRPTNQSAQLETRHFYYYSRFTHDATEPRRVRVRPVSDIHVLQRRKQNRMRKLKRNCRASRAQVYPGSQPDACHVSRIARHAKNVHEFSRIWGHKRYVNPTRHSSFYISQAGRAQFRKCCL